MGINGVYIENFRGIRDARWIDIKPITIFVGANSSGKSSCIHALAALAQTLKIPNNSRPLILDDEFASVHLGRFIEVIHTKSYQDLISLGVRLEPFSRAELRDDKLVRIKNTGEAVYNFKSTKRTQDTHLEHAQLTIGEHEYTAKRSNQVHMITHGAEGTAHKFSLETGFIFSNDGVFHLRNPTSFIPMIALQREIMTELQNVLYLGPFRQAPQRRYATRGSSPSEVGSMGEYTITMLANEVVQTTSRKHRDEIAGWLQVLGLAQNLNVARVAGSDLFDINLTLADGTTFPIADLGYGLSQILPVLTQCSFAHQGATLLFEQPELHLHSIAARELAKVFIQTAQQKRAKVLLETHSPDLIAQFQHELRQGTLALGDIVIYRVTRAEGQTVLSPIQIDPEDFDIYERWEAGISVLE